MQKEQFKMELIERKALMVNGVEAIEAFDECKLVLKTQLGVVWVKGEGLTVKNMDLDAGQVDVEGTINGIEYVEDKGAKMKAKGKSVLSKLVR